MNHYTDVVVVGARAAGAATAMLLARAGLDVTVIDRSRQGADTLSTHALMRGAVIQLHRWGLLDRITAAGTPPVTRTTFHYTTGSTTIDIEPGGGIDALYAPRRTVLDPLLATSAEEAGAAVHFGFTVTQVLRRPDGRACGVLGTDRLGRTTTIRAGLVVGADGFRSIVAVQMGAPVERTGRGAGGYLYQYRAGVAADGYEWVFRPQVTAGVIPTNDGLTCVFVGSSPERIASRDSTLFPVLLAEASIPVTHRVLGGRQVGPTRRFLGRPGVMRTPWGPGWALVGDAGYWKDPISAHGLTDALRDAELLSTAVVDAFGSTEARARVACMRRYHDTRNRLSADLFDITDRIATPGWTDDEIPGLLRSLSGSMAGEVDHLTALTPRSAAAATAGAGAR
jgi:2-polyprenyl-6-methoxyphenol hydroxylase-like FAD-dependent oxidoreductase